ncbi:MAG TPA: hypothetical protein VFN07_09390 [Trueperaceae bacterium]|nr:hypothetical protein [Trueperaceae bacterium]
MTARIGMPASLPAFGTLVVVATTHVMSALLVHVFHEATTTGRAKMRRVAEILA